MHFNTILFPTDFSTASDAALPVATMLARDTGARLVIVHVEEAPVAYGGGELYYGMPEPDRPTLAKMLDAVRPTDPHVPCDHRMLVGDPAKEIVKAAEDEHADVIVMGTHGRTGLSWFLMGSVAEQIVRLAECPVLTLKHPIPEAVENPVYAPLVGAAI